MDDRGEWMFRDKTLDAGGGHGWLAHDHAVVTLVLHGRLDEGLASEVQSCGAFELHYKPRGLGHATSTGPRGVRMLLAGARGRALERLEPRGGGVSGVISGGSRAARALRELLAIAAADPGREEAPADPMRRLWEEATSTSGDGGGVRPGWITEVYERIEREGARRQSLARLAREFRVHPVYLARAFRSAFGLTIGSLRRRVRADRAVARLSVEATSLANLALELGYADQNHFTREFKRETGWTPARFRSVVGSL